MNKCSFSGLTENSTFSHCCHPTFLWLGADKLARSLLIKHWKIINIDYLIMNVIVQRILLFLDPPYDIKISYMEKIEMHKSFDHDVFRRMSKMSISSLLNVNERLEELKNYELTHWKCYSMAHRGDKGTDDNVKTELLVTNYSLTPKTPLEEQFVEQ